MALEIGEWYLIQFEPDGDSVPMSVAKLDKNNVWRDEDGKSFCNVIGWQELPSEKSFNPLPDPGEVE
jgi:hypothetical protein